MRILLVDDEPSLLQLLGQYLTRAGHVVIDANSCRSAMALLAGGAGHLDAAVIDLGLPDGSGEDIARAVLGLDPSIRTIMATGYAYEPPQELRDRLTVLQKPYLPRALLALLLSPTPL